MVELATDAKIPKENPPAYSEATGESYINPNFVPESSNSHAAMTNVVGSTEAPANDSEAQFASPGLTDQAIRRRFIRKVYLILTAQLLITIAFIAIFQFVKPVKEYVKSNLALYISAL